MKGAKIHNAEKRILLFILIVSIYFFLEGFSYIESSRIFPQLTSGVAIAGSILLLVRGYMPKLSTVIEGEGENSKQEDTFSYKRDSLVFITILFVIFGYLIGFLWALPVFIGLYSHIFSLNTKETLIIFTTGLLIIIGFVVVLGVDFHVGILTEDLFL